MTSRPLSFMLTGVALMVVGWIVIFISVSGMLAPNFAVLIGAYCASFSGLVLGLIGMLEYRRLGK